MIPREAHAPKYILGRNKIACQNNFGSKIYFGKPSQTPSVTLLTLQTHSNTFQIHFKQLPDAPTRPVNTPVQQER